MIKRATIILVACVALLVGATPASAAPGASVGVWAGNAWSTDCTGVIGVTCTFHFGGPVVNILCLETAAGVPTGAFGCGVYGHLFFSGVGTTQTCAGTAAGDAIVYSSVIGGWTTVPITGVVASGVLQFAGVGFAGSLTRTVTLQGQAALVGGCASGLGLAEGTFVVEAV